ncbi:DUF1501 domain-containing protein [Azospirillum melinis]|uniref:DUF1501 domain-containing protein n=1 Tax=Azospirillum melinis TaxID=328839 RepID=A0ABX2KCP8_9PROT|nr:DUF1501 domain-containing protein [Azospirillum melinis]MBP2307303.1 uncharacterized protein (DUF1501 family) [Azospirillum melinis]NUB01383.1 DUF1501 domain-containing protein [Azospirillum melinis]
MALSRRTVMQGGLMAGLGLAGGSLTGLPGVRSLAFAADKSVEAPVGTLGAGTLVVVFLRGGADMLALVAPADDPDYRAARTPELRVMAEGPKAGIRLDQTLAPTLDFRLHPDAAPLAELYAARRLAIVHAVGLTDGTRSHFVAQDLMERGIAREEDLARTGSGWVARWLGEGGHGEGEQGRVPAIGTAAAPAAALAGLGGALAVPDLRGGLAPPGGPQAAAVLAALSRQGDGAYERAARAALGGLSAVDGRLPRGTDGKVAAYDAEGGAVYEETEAGRALQTVARMLKMDIGLRAACVDVAGWDTHENQQGRFATAVGQLSRALAAFHADTLRYERDLTVVVMSEFGRRLRGNRSQGTDHGHGGAMLVLGGRVAGGRMLGRWPGLASHQLDRGVDLAVTTDYRTVLSELIGAPATRGFPGFQGAPLGVLRG